MKKKRICLLLAIVMLLSCLLFGCGEPQEAEEETEELSGIMQEDKFLVQGGKSDYVLILPSNPMEMETFAAEEFTTFMQEATGAEFQTVSEQNAADSAHYISIGNTAQFQQAFPDVDLSELKGKQSSYFIASKDDNIYVVSGDSFKGEGSLYAIYDVLHDLIGYTYYSDTEIYFVESSDVNLWKYEEHFVKPSFEMRTHSTNYIYGHHQHNDRLRYINFSHGSEWNRITNGHSQLEDFLHPTDIGEDGVPYGESHPEWFVNPFETTKAIQTNQLCWTAGGDAESLALMQTVVANKMIEYLQMDPEAHFFMFGQHDNSDACTCDGCTAAKEEWAANPAGLQIGFFNGVVEQVEQWREANMPDREVYYVVYAYLFTQEPPVKKDADGNYVAYSDKVIPNERVRIFYAPVDANYAFPFDSTVNRGCEEQIQGWSALCTEGQLFAYLYDLNCYYYYINFYNFGTVQSMLQELADAGVTYLLIQGASDQANIPGFQDLRAYVTSNLMWDVNRNYQEMASDFIVHYYKDASEYMQNVFDMICDQNAYYTAAEDFGSGTIKAVPSLTKLYPRAFVEKMDEQFALALESIAHYEETDPEMYQSLKDRIMKEYLSVIYLKAVVYGDNYSEEEMAEMRDTWNYYNEYFGIKNGGEGQPLPEF